MDEVVDILLSHAKGLGDLCKDQGAVSKVIEGFGVEAEPHLDLRPVKTLRNKVLQPVLKLNGHHGQAHLHQRPNGVGSVEPCVLNLDLV